MMDHRTTEAPDQSSVTPTSEIAAPEMGDIFDKLAVDIRRTVVEGCAKVAEIHLIRITENQWQRGYNDACRAIAAKIREL